MKEIEVSAIMNGGECFCSAAITPGGAIWLYDAEVSGWQIYIDVDDFDRAMRFWNARILLGQKVHRGIFKIKVEDSE